MTRCFAKLFTCEVTFITEKVFLSWLDKYLVEHFIAILISFLEIYIGGARCQRFGKG